VKIGNEKNTDSIFVSKLFANKQFQGFAQKLVLGKNAAADYKTWNLE